MEQRKIPRPSSASKFSEQDVMKAFFRFRDIAHKFHLNCFVDGVGSHAEHLALDGLYKGIQELQDDILEQMMGYLGKPINTSNDASDIPQYKGKQQAVDLCNEIQVFAKDLIRYADSNDMPNIENLGQELSGLAAHTKYFLMFK